MLKLLVGLVPTLLLAAAPSFAQAPNNAAVVVIVADQSGAAVPDARVSILNTQTGATRDAVSGADGSVTIAALPINGAYDVTVTKDGFQPESSKGLTLQAGETATLRVRLLVGNERAEVTVYGTSSGVGAEPSLGVRFTPQQIQETPLLGRKISSLPLLNAAFRPAKGTGDLFVNTTYVVTAAGGRRETTVTVDGASDDEPWGRQTALITLPLGAVAEMSAMTNAFSAEFGWTAGPALNIVTKSGSNDVHGDGLYLGRPGAWQTTTFSTTGFCPPSVSSCVTPGTLTGMKPPDVPDTLNQGSVTLGGPIVRDKTFFFASDDFTQQNRTAYLSASLPSFVLPADGSLVYQGKYRQELLDARVDHKFTPTETLMVRANVDRFSDTNPQDAVGGTAAPTVARTYKRHGWSLQANHTSILSPALLNEVRFTFLNGDPVTGWFPATLSTTYSRSGSVPFTIGQSRAADLYSRQGQVSDTVTWLHGRHSLRIGGSAARHTSGGQGGEFGTALLGTFTFKNTTTAPFDQLTLADVQQYTQPISFGTSTYNLSQWLLAGYVQDSIRATNDLTIDAGLRYDRQTLTDATKNVAPRVGFGWHPGGRAKLAVRGGYGMYYTQIRSNVYAAALTGGLDGLATYSAVPGQLGFPTCLTGSCLPLSFDPRTLAPGQIPARDITINPGMRSFYEQQFAQYGLNFDALPNYPDTLLNPRSQVMSIGAEREIATGLFVSADYVHQHWSNIDRTVDINAPAPFDRTAPGQVR
ncbi:MAG TPA: TonB-dependent receptor, partial [Vicinamibacterales bacterium]|nr:TonB-dependent receptor [Vicinamibacterales bacterium]